MVKKDWRERMVSRMWWGGDDGETKVRRRGRLLMWALEERSWFPRVLRSERVYFSLFFCFFDKMEAMAAAEKTKLNREGGFFLLVYEGL